MPSRSAALACRRHRYALCGTGAMAKVQQQQPSRFPACQGCKVHGFISINLFPDLQFNM